ncbi:MAG: PspC domain-containing protein [Bacteroidota bacterium]|nr:PspC domain-containing protein [Bacteroidota bacterium]
MLRRSIENKKIAGVCGGLAEYLDIDPTIVRLIFVLLTLSSFGLGILLYIVLAIAMPHGKNK